MTGCRVCADKGIVRFDWSDAPSDFGLCLCATGLDMRRRDLWRLWCARERVELARMFLLEEVLTPEELAATGYERPARPVGVSREAALLAAGKTRRQPR